MSLLKLPLLLLFFKQARTTCTLGKASQHDQDCCLVTFQLLVHNMFSAVSLTLRLLMYIYGAPSKARNANVVYIWTYVCQR